MGLTDTKDTIAKIASVALRHLLLETHGKNNKKLQLFRRCKVKLLFLWNRSGEMYSPITCDKIQGTVKHKHFRQKVFVRYKKIDK